MYADELIIQADRRREHAAPAHPPLALLPTAAQAVVSRTTDRTASDQV